MPSFDEMLASVRGKIHVVNISDGFEHGRGALLYYWNCAEPLYLSAKIIWDARGPSNVAAMLVGMSMELLLKGIHVAFDRQFKTTHRLDKLCANVGIEVSADDKIILWALSEHVIWASRYPVPKSAERLSSATDLFSKQVRSSGNLAHRDIKERELSRGNCERLWMGFAEGYQKVREARFESAEHIFE